ncbi:MAG: hypothetical protein ACRD3I_03640 [Terriglobales bacterium]
MAQSSTAEYHPEARSGTDARPRPQIGGSTAASLGALTVAMIEGVCAGLVLLKGVALSSSVLALTAGGASSWIHEDRVRIPLMVLASGVALANLFMVANGWRLRRNPAAAWRVRPLTFTEKRRIGFVILASIATLALIASEIYGHHVLHAG